MANDWQELTVKELQTGGCLLVEDGNHGEYRPRHDEFTNSGVAFIRAADMNNGQVEFASTSKINDVAQRRITKGIGAGGDVLLSHKGTVGKVAFVPLDAPPFVCSPQTTFWRSLDENAIDRRYLYVYMRSEHFRRQLNSRKGETDMADYVSLTAQRELKILLPPISEQRAIAEVLGALDDKIELNRRMNVTLESMARAVFRQWFVENEEAQGWQEKSLDEIANFLNGLALQNFPPEGNAFLPVIKIAQLRKNDTEGADKASTNIPSQYIVEDGDILFSWSGSLEVVIWCGGKGALNQHLFKVTSEQYPKWFYYFWTKHHLADFQEIAAGKATTMGHIQRHHLSDAEVLVPDSRRLREMDKFMSPLLDQIIITNLESRTLANLRDSLLPKLMRGEVRVKDMENSL